MDLVERRKRLKESIKYKYFKDVEQALEYYTFLHDEVKRQKLISLYNRLGSIVYHIGICPITTEKETLNAFKDLKGQFNQVVEDFKTIVGDDAFKFVGFSII